MRNRPAFLRAGAVIVAIMAMASLHPKAVHGQDRSVPSGSAGRAVLAAAGFRHDDEASLVAALRHRDTTVAVVAAHTLSRYPPSARVLTTLTATVSDPRERVLVAALPTLQSMNTTGWEQAAVRRLPSMYDPEAQLLVAGILARAGLTDG